MKLKKINYHKAKYQGVRNFECPECSENFLHDENHSYVIGYDITSNGRHVIICECPHCFIKSYCHSNRDHIASIERLKSQAEE